MPGPAPPLPPAEELVAGARAERDDAPVLVRDPQAPAAPLATPAAPLLARRRSYLHDYAFENDWFTHNIPQWVALLEPYAGRPGLRYLEVGLWEGRSFLWMLDHVLTHPSARATGVDLVLSDTLRRNLERSGAADRVTLLEGASQLELRRLPLASQDIVYIDGSHTAGDVLEDMVLAWRLLEPGGLMILDDYRWKGWRDPEREALPDELLPGLAIDAFVSANRSTAQVVSKGYQVVLRKRALSCPAVDGKCSSLGDYSYDWQQQQLYRDGAEVALSDAERRLVETLIRSKRGDGETLALPAGLRASTELGALSRRLGLGLD